MSSTTGPSAILFGRRKDSGERRGSRSRRSSAKEGQETTPRDDGSLTSDVQSLTDAIHEVENSPEHQAQKQAIEKARKELRVARQAEPPIHSGLTVAQRLRIKEQKKKRLNKGRTNFREAVISDNSNMQEGGGLVDEVLDSGRGSFDDVGNLRDAEELPFTGIELRIALTPSRTYREKLFYHEPPEPEKLFHYEGHVTKMKMPDNNAARDFVNVRAGKKWKDRMGSFIEHEHVGAKMDDKELFLEKNGAGGDSIIMVDNQPTNPNRIITRSELRTLRVSNLLQTTQLPPYLTEVVSKNPSESTSKRIKSAFDDSWTPGD